MSRTYFENVYRTGSDVWSHIPYHQEIAQYIDSMPGEHPYILELGVGRALSLLPLKNTRHKLFGIDTNPQVIRETKEQIRKEKIKNIGVVEASADEIPFTDEAFDLVSDGGIFTYLSDEEIFRVVKEVERVIKPNGFFLHIGYSIKTTSLYGYRPRKDELQSQEFIKFGVPHRIFSEHFLKNRFLKHFDQVFHEERTYDSRTDPGEQLVLNFIGYQRK
ncbi:MAG TPA: class I SAM-dependent methyltransferase [Candidatus Paceibacterota bacterium]